MCLREGALFWSLTAWRARLQLQGNFTPLESPADAARSERVREATDAQVSVGEALRRRGARARGARHGVALRDASRRPPYAARVQAERARLAAFRGAARGAPAPVYRKGGGDGVVMAGGGGRLLPSALASLRVLRASGCALRAELWSARGEELGAEGAAELRRLGTEQHVVEDYVDAALAGAEGGAELRWMASARPLRGFGLKAAALVLTSFERVLFLDADNFVARDPTPLFQAEPFRAHGAVFWPDLWERTVTEAALDVLDLGSAADRAALEDGAEARAAHIVAREGRKRGKGSESAEATLYAAAAPFRSRPLPAAVQQGELPPGTHDSGQMLVDVSRCWEGVLSALYMNLAGRAFYPMLTGVGVSGLGEGDKETFPYAWLHAGLSYALAPPPASAGYISTALDERLGGALEDNLGRLSPWAGYVGHTMVQHAPSAAGGAGRGSGSGGAATAPAAAFLHRNLRKLARPPPGELLTSEREWQVVARHVCARASPGGSHRCAGWERWGMVPFDLGVFPSANASAVHYSILADEVDLGGLDVECAVRAVQEQLLEAEWFLAHMHVQAAWEGSTAAAEWLPDASLHYERDPVHAWIPGDELSRAAEAALQQMVPSRARGDAPITKAPAGGNSEASADSRAWLICLFVLTLLLVVLGAPLLPPGVARRVLRRMSPRDLSHTL